jgi:hypothetical protein
MLPMPPDVVPSCGPGGGVGIASCTGITPHRSDARQIAQLTV